MPRIDSSQRQARGQELYSPCQKRCVSDKKLLCNNAGDPLEADAARSYGGPFSSDMKTAENVILRSLATLDPASRLRVRIFSLKLLTAIPISVVLATHQNYPVLAAMSFIFFWNSVFAGFAALFQGHRYNAAFLTAWDEMAAFLALAVLTRTIGSVIA